MVFLAEHLVLGEYRAIKRVRRTEGEALREAEILRILHHPGIPVLYDVESDDTHTYLIEEYLDGESLASLMQREGSLTAARQLRYGEELCRIMEYLHNVEPEPIYYCDLQPENIILCRGHVMLVDYDRARTKAMEPDAAGAYGAEGFAPPELYRGGTPDERTDLYGIGAVLYYMATGHAPPGDGGGSTDREMDSLRGLLPAGYTELIRRALSREPFRRPGSAREMGEALRSIRQIAEKHAVSSFHIAVCGSTRGIGVTSLCREIARYLTDGGARCLIREQNHSAAFQKLARYRNRVPDEYGILREGGMLIRPNYGPGVLLAGQEYDVYVDDFGDELQSFSRSEADLMLLVCGTEDWQMEDTVLAMETAAARGLPAVTVIFRDNASGKRPVVPRHLTGMRCLRCPARGKEMKAFLREMLSDLNIPGLSGRQGGIGPGMRGKHVP